jgi:hypothetical protein
VGAQFPQLREGALAAAEGALEGLGVGVVERGVHDRRRLLFHWAQCRCERHERGSNRGWPADLRSRGWGTGQHVLGPTDILDMPAICTQHGAWSLEKVSTQPGFANK